MHVRGKVILLRMGLLPLEFTDCLQDSPYFRDSLHSHEKELERTSQAIKELIKEVKSLLQAAKSKKTRQLWWSSRPEMGFDVVCSVITRISQ